jgi:hypothetical protein
MAAKLTRLTHKIAIQQHLVLESCTICSSRSKRPVQKLLDTLSYTVVYQKKVIFSSKIYKHPHFVFYFLSMRVISVDEPALNNESNMASEELI